jgi:methylated-DNA-protein-cysteine methyltransferase-like protein
MLNSLFLFSNRKHSNVRTMMNTDEVAGPNKLLPLQYCFERAKMLNWNAVYKLVKTIPRGSVATYGQIAKALKLPGGSRSAGRAMAACPSGRGIPWHRVVGAGGRLLIREPNADLQRRLLESEGLELAEKRILNFPVHQWRPRKKARG